MAHQNPPASELLPLLTAAFPQTFSADPKQVRPLKINIHHDLDARFQAHTLPAELDPGGIKRFLHWYTQRTAYLKALARGESRVDLTGAGVDSDIPEVIREQARQELARRQALKTGTAGLRKTTPTNPAAALLPRLAAVFPQAFFADPKQVRPLKVFLYRDLLQVERQGALPAGIDRTALKSFLRWYGRRTAYLNAVARGLGRIDLTGAVVTATIPEDLRKSARAEVQRRQAHRAAQATTTAATAASPALTPTPVPIPYTLEELYAMAVDAKLEVTLKFTAMPNAKPAGPGKMAFALKTPDGQFVTAEVSTKAWNKVVKAAQEWPAWTAALSGTMGARTEKGFTLANPGLQVFERKPKAPAEAASPATGEGGVPSAPPAVARSAVTTAETASASPARWRPALSLKKNEIAS